MPAKIVVIEDDPVQQKLYSLLCLRVGCQVELFAEAELACQYLQDTSARPQLVVLDCMLNGKNGLQFVPTIKQIAAAGDYALPVVAITARAYESDKQACLLAGADEYLPKPFTIQQFMSVIGRWTTSEVCPPQVNSATV